jgi:hypothetical protein
VPIQSRPHILSMSEPSENLPSLSRDSPLLPIRITGSSKNIVLCPERTLQWESPVSYDFMKVQEATARRMFPRRSFQIASGQTSLCHRILLSRRCFPSHSERDRADLSEFQPEDSVRQGLSIVPDRLRRAYRLSELRGRNFRVGYRLLCKEYEVLILT